MARDEGGGEVEDGAPRDGRAAVETARAVLKIGGREYEWRRAETFEEWRRATTLSGSLYDAEGRRLVNLGDRSIAEIAAALAAQPPEVASTDANEPENESALGRVRVLEGALRQCEQVLIALNSHGGLGYDRHRWIDEALVKAQGALAEPRDARAPHNTEPA